MRRAGACALLLLAGLALPLQAETYRISSVEYGIEGQTRQDALERKFPVDTEKVFGSIEEYAAYKEKIAQRLANERVFAETEISDELSEPDGGGNVSVRWKISVRDTKNLLVLPYPKYDSNTGLTAKLKAKNNDLLGTMEPLSLDIFFASLKDDDAPDEDEAETQKAVGLALDFTLPFSLWKFDAEWLNSYSIQYTFGDSAPEYALTTGLRFTLPFKRFKLALTAAQSAARNDDYEEFGDEIFATESALFEVPVTLLDTQDFGELELTPFSSAEYNWDSDRITDENEDLAGPYMEAGNRLSFGQINWQENFRSGFSAYVQGTIGRNAQLEVWRPGVKGELAMHCNWKIFGPSLRFYGFWYENGKEKIGERLRGIADEQRFAKPLRSLTGRRKALDVSSALALNADVPIRILRTDWLEWKNSIFGAESLSWLDGLLSAADFELQAAPFFDCALTHNAVTGRTFDWRDGWYAGGIELIVFPARWKSIQVRASVGFDLGRIFLEKKLDTSWRNTGASKTEIYIGIGLLY